MATRNSLRRDQETDVTNPSRDKPYASSTGSGLKKLRSETLLPKWMRSSTRGMDPGQATPDVDIGLSDHPKVCRDKMEPKCKKSGISVNSPKHDMP